MIALRPPGPGRDLETPSVQRHPALQAAELAMQAGAKVELMTPDRGISPDVMGMNISPYLKALQQGDVTFTIARRLLEVTRQGNRLEATTGTDYGPARWTGTYDQVVVNYGTRPLDELYFDLRPGSSNLGAVDHDALLAGTPQQVLRNPDGQYRLFRIGDAVAARNTHAAIYDALRLVRTV